MNGWLKYFTAWFVKPVLTVYLKKDRPFRYKQLQLIIFKGVFHPQFFFSSKYLASFVEKLDVDGKNFCEPCAGSGLISLVALQKGATVTAFDINPKAVETIFFNFNKNKKQLKSQALQVLESNLFAAIPPTIFDFIVLNPPYFFKEYTSLEQAAWNAGKDGQFFSTFFEQLSNFSNKNSEIYMVLADNCNLLQITTIANDNHWMLSLIEQRKILWEMNYIYRITLLE
jgi:release factor glutamine methyltransferase